MAKNKAPVLKNEQDLAESSPWRRYAGDIRIWGVLLLVPLALFTIAVVFDLGPRDEPVQDTSCNFSHWIGKQYNLPAIRETGRQHRFISKGGTLPPSGDDSLINIELQGTTVTNIWCG